MTRVFASGLVLLLLTLTGWSDPVPMEIPLEEGLVEEQPEAITIRRDNRALESIMRKQYERVPELLEEHSSSEPPVSPDSYQLTVMSTAYCLTGTTASGYPAGPGVIAVDPSVIPLGTRVYVPGYGEAYARDTGGVILGRKIDIWLPTAEQCYQWGYREVTITIYND